MSVRCRLRLAPGSQNLHNFEQKFFSHCDGHNCSLCSQLRVSKGATNFSSRSSRREMRSFSLSSFQNSSSSLESPSHVTCQYEQGRLLSVNSQSSKDLRTCHYARATAFSKSLRYFDHISRPRHFSDWAQVAVTTQPFQYVLFGFTVLLPCPLSTFSFHKLLSASNISPVFQLRNLPTNAWITRSAATILSNMSCIF